MIMALQYPVAVLKQVMGFTVGPQGGAPEAERGRSYFLGSSSGLMYSMPQGPMPLSWMIVSSSV